MTIQSNLFRNTPYFLNFIFNGQMWTFRHRLSIAGNTTVDAIQVKTGSPKLIHAFQRTMTVEGGGPYVISLVEAPATITDGTLLTTNHNMDRRSTKTSQLQYFSNPTNVTGGIIIDEDFVPTGSGPKATGSFAGSGVERVLKVNTTYVLRVQNQSSNAGTFQFNILTYDSGN